jgi:hypothetical protein
LAFCKFGYNGRRIPHRRKRIARRLQICFVAHWLSHFRSTRPVLAQKLFRREDFQICPRAFTINQRLKDGINFLKDEPNPSAVIRSKLLLLISQRFANNPAADSG